MNKLLKDELGFKGYVMSDWNGMWIHYFFLTSILLNK